MAFSRQPGFYTSTWAGLFACALILGKVNLASSTALAFLAAGIWLAAAAAVFFLFYNALRGAGTGPRRKASWLRRPVPILNFLLMYPLSIGAFGPIDALAIGFSPALDAFPTSGIFDLCVRVGLRAALLGALAWSSVYIIRKTAAASLGRIVSGWPFFAGFILSYAVKFVVEY